MVVVKASLKFKSLNASDKVSFGANVCTQLGKFSSQSTNPFPNLPVPVADLQTINTALNDASAAMKQGGKTASEVLKEAKKVWDAAFTVTAVYVSVQADGIGSVITDAGFDCTKTSKSKKPLAGGIKDFKATVNHSKGAITVGTKKAADNADGYIFTAVPANASVNFAGNMMSITIGENTIYIAASTRKQLDMTALSKGVPVMVTMNAFNSTGAGPAASFQEVIPQ